jgi:enoyl-CoA hydratase
MKFKAITYEKKGRAAHIVLGIPEGAPSSYETIYAELADVCDAIAKDDSISVAVIKHAGETLLHGSTAESDSFVSQAIEAVARLEKISVAVINGDVIDAGLELALACDIRIAGDRSRFAIKNVDEGAIPCGGGTQRLPRLVGQSKAMEMILTGDTIDAAEAYRIGLIQKVVPYKDIVKESDILIEKIADKAPIALRFCKEAVNKGMDLTLEQGFRLEADLYFLIQTTGDRMEGIKSFLEKRKPLFKGE